MIARPRAPLPLLAVLVALLGLAGCGGSGGSDTAANGDRPAAAKARAGLNGADAPQAADFPATGGRTLRQVADRVEAAQGQVGLASTIFTPGRNRLAFGVIGADNRFVYAPSAVYIARTPDSKAKGPFPAPADLLVTEPAYRSKQAATESDPFAAIYESHVAFDRPGTWTVLVTNKVGGRLVGTPTEVKVLRRSPVPAVGDKPPAVDTDTVARAGSVEAIDTRRPTSDMHAKSFKDVVGKKPVALLFATPQLCQSRVCGPVVDIALQLEQKYGDRMQFIHQEVYVDNNPNKGLRPPLRAFNLQTEPWLFTVGKDGRIAARLEGSFGLKAFEQAIQAALKQG